MHDCALRFVPYVLILSLSLFVAACPRDVPKSLWEIAHYDIKEAEGPEEDRLKGGSSKGLEIEWRSDSMALAWVTRKPALSRLNHYSLKDGQLHSFEFDGGIFHIDWNQGQTILLSLFNASAATTALIELNVETGDRRTVLSSAEIPGLPSQAMYSYDGERLAYVDLVGPNRGGYNIHVSTASGVLSGTAITSEGINQWPTWLVNDIGIVYEKTSITPFPWSLFGSGVKTQFALHLFEGQGKETVIDSTALHSNDIWPVGTTLPKIRYIKYRSKSRRSASLCEYTISERRTKELINLSEVLSDDSQIRAFSMGRANDWLAVTVSSESLVEDSIWLLSARERSANRVVHGPGISSTQLSPDCSKLAYIDSTRGLRIVDLSELLGERVPSAVEESRR